MRMRAIVASAAVATVLGATLTGCTPAPRAHDGPVVIPQAIAWRYAMSCITSAGDVGVTELQWSNEGAEVKLDVSNGSASEIAGLEDQVEECLTAHRYEEAVDTFVDPYERERLYEYYQAVTVPCLQRQGIDLPPAPHVTFAVAGGGEPWNPYLGMDLPFDRLLELYRECPPRPSSLPGTDTG